MSATFVHPPLALDTFPGTKTAGKQTRLQPSRWRLAQGFAVAFHTALPDAIVLTIAVASTAASALLLLAALGLRAA